MQNRQLPEILAPAGGMESLVAAVRCGADAVYLGGQALNARRGAENFDKAQLFEAVSYCHVRGVRVYLTLNTLVFDSELPRLPEVVEDACAAGVDALIVQDLAVAALARERAPDMPLHASTQMGVHDAGGVRLLGELGFSRVVLARELSREEIGAIAAETDLELECFVHGALCYSVSGQCTLSAMIGGRSGNRGMCAQPCRLPFSGGGCGHTLSLRDLSLIPHVRELGDMGVCSLKIEGRMKRPEYVAAAVTACRRALAGEEPDFAALEAVFSRSGFTADYFAGAVGDNLLGTRRHEDVRAAAPVLKELGGLYRGEYPGVPVSLDLTLRRDEPAVLTARDRDGNTARATGPVPQQARTAPTTPERAAAALGKTGGTFYTISNIHASIDEELILPASALNALRRQVLEQLTALRTVGHPVPCTPGPLPAATPPHAGTPHPLVRVRLGRAAQITPALCAQADQLVLPAEEFPLLDRGLLPVCRDKLLVEIPPVVFGRHGELHSLLRDVKAGGITGATVGGLGAVDIARAHGFTLHGDAALNIVNTFALAEYERLGLVDATLSFELGLGKIRSMGGALPRGIVAYGHLPLMAARRCPAGNCADCGRNFPAVTDRLGNRFFADCLWGVGRLHNHVPLYLADRLDEIGGVDFLTLYYTREAPDQCLNLLRRYRTGESMAEPFTRGLYYRKVL